MVAGAQNICFDGTSEILKLRGFPDPDDGAQSVPILSSLEIKYESSKFDGQVFDSFKGVKGGTELTCVSLPHQT